jgi:hypothetical protein
MENGVAALYAVSNVAGEVLDAAWNFASMSMAIYLP